MIWLTWRQHRGEMVWAVFLLALLAALLFLSSRAMFTAYAQVQHGTSVAVCARSHSQDAVCDALKGEFYNQFGGASVLLLALTILPGLVGMFFGAPLVAREIERATNRLAWTQGITRLRWLWVKLGALVLSTAALFAAFALLLSWWRGPLDLVGGERFEYGFDLEGVAPVAYAVFALALGVAAGALLRRTLPAMAVTLGCFVALRGVIEFALRPRFLPPIARVTDPGQGNPTPYNGDWVLNNGFAYLDRQGHAISSADATQLCSNVAKGGAFNFNACLQQQGIHLLNHYQPADRFWLFQGIESGIFFGLAVVLLALAVWWVMTRLT
ncbi:MAG TPA: ABC transporter permease subunit [Ktedonobacterales bacterium]|nr:ABC transporter permease subunit [Ktedonobacterales bacterium]